ncbi:hypothetical protein CMUS01_02893 [Colletotrichum musicola]|uniref:Uncharacterized protein n=1 Tax=Colletotrichum musicola TaxID=2175873 RepID=A0A8H6NU32_9PEZI|nr:hypothetical protein CMUS01_02893 [Colletotrichum musicola]
MVRCAPYRSAAAAIEAKLPSDHRSPTISQTNGAHRPLRTFWLVSNASQEHGRSGGRRLERRRREVHQTVAEKTRPDQTRPADQQIRPNERNQQAGYGARTCNAGAHRTASQPSADTDPSSATPPEQ